MVTNSLLNGQECSPKEPLSELLTVAAALTVELTNFRYENVRNEDKNLKRRLKRFDKAVKFNQPEMCVNGHAGNRTASAKILKPRDNT